MVDDSIQRIPLFVILPAKKAVWLNIYTYDNAYAEVFQTDFG